MSRDLGIFGGSASVGALIRSGEHQRSEARNSAAHSYHNGANGEAGPLALVAALWWIAESLAEGGADGRCDAEAGGGAAQKTADDVGEDGEALPAVHAAGWGCVWRFLARLILPSKVSILVRSSKSLGHQRTSA